MNTPDRKGSFALHEDRTILRKYGTVPNKRLADILRRTESSIIRRALHLFEGPPVQGPWTDAEIKKLRTVIGMASATQVATILRRKEADVYDAIKKLRAREKRNVSLTGAELAEFKVIYGSRDDHDLAVIFLIKLETVARMAEQQCLQKDKTFLKSQGIVTIKMPRWTQDEVDLLTRIYPNTSNHEIARRLKRSTKSVVSKAHSLHLKKDQARLQQMGRDNVSKRYL